MKSPRNPPAGLDDAFQHDAVADGAALEHGHEEQQHEEQQYEEELAGDEPAVEDAVHGDGVEHALPVADHDSSDALLALAADAAAGDGSKPEQLEEWQRMVIPHDWLPSPTLRVHFRRSCRRAGHSC